jgi:hypothetical protein
MIFCCGVRSLHRASRTSNRHLSDYQYYPLHLVRVNLLVLFERKQFDYRYLIFPGLPNYDNDSVKSQSKAINKTQDENVRGIFLLIVFSENH